MRLTKIIPMNQQLQSIFWLVCSLLIFVYCFSISAQERILTLQESLRCALLNRNELLSCQEEVNIACEKVKEASAFFYPKIDFTVNYSQLDSDKLMILPPIFGSILLPQVTLGHYYFTRISLWHHIYSGGRYQSNLFLAQMNFDRAKSELERVKNEIIYEVKKKYYELLYKTELINIYSTTVAELKEVSLEKTDKLYQKLYLENMLTEIDINITQLQNELLQEKLNFLTSIGLELDTTFIIESKMQYSFKQIDAKKLLSQALEYRSELKQKKYEEKIDDLSVKLALAERYPIVGLGIHYERAGEELSLVKTNWNVTFNLTLPLFEGWVSWSRIRQKRSILRKSKLQRAKIEDTIRLEVQQACNNYIFWQERVPLWEKRIMKSRDEVDSIKKDLPSGKTSLLDFIEAYRGYLQAQQHYLEALKNHLISYALLEKAVGKVLAE